MVVHMFERGETCRFQTLVADGGVVLLVLALVLWPVVGVVGPVAATGSGGTDAQAVEVGPPGQTTNDTDGGNRTTDNGGPFINDSTGTTWAETELDRMSLENVSYEPNYTIEFWSGTFTPDPGLESAVTETDRDRVWVLVQFQAPPYASTIDDLATLGYRDKGQLSATTRYAEIPRDEAESIAQRDSVRAVAAVQDGWKQRPGFDQQVANLSSGERVRASVQTFANLSAQTIDEYELTPLATDERGVTTYGGNLSATAVRDLISRDRVFWIEERARPQTDVSEGRRLVGGRLADRAGPGSRPGYDGSGVRVGVIDTGLEDSHRHFDGVTVDDAKDWWDAGRPIGDPQDSDPPGNCDHGTHVAGTIAGSGDDYQRDIEIRGVAPAADLIPSNTFKPKNGDPSASKCGWIKKPVGLKKIFNKVDNNNVDIISNSWGDDTDGNYDIRASWTDTWAYNNPDVLLVTSAGNAGQTSHVGSPAVGKNVLAVGALHDGSGGSEGNVDHSTIGMVNDDTSYNQIDPPTDVERGSGRQKPELYAPGIAITAPGLNSDYIEKGGTSMAAPHVSGVAALIKDRHPGMSANHLRALLVSTAAPPRLDGYGLVNANNALTRSPYESAQKHAQDSVKRHRGLTLTKQAKQKKKRVQNDHYTVSVSENAEKLDVTLSWLDPGNLVSSRSDRLSNNLHLRVDGPGTSRRIDTDSNIKRTVIDDPAAGEWTITVHANEVTALTSQDYDLMYRVVTENATLEVTDGRNETVQPWEPRTREYDVAVNGTGAPVTGVTLDIDNESGVARCDDERDPIVVGTLSEDRRFARDVCGELPLPSTPQTYNITHSVTSTNAERIGDTETDSVTRDVTYEVLPAPNADRFESNDRLDDAAAVGGPDGGWNHSHLRCRGSGRFSGDRLYWDDCRDVLTGGDPVTAREHWDQDDRLSNLTLDSDQDEDFYEFSLPGTDTPSLSEPECGNQTVRMAGEDKQVETEGKFVVEVTATETRHGNATARIDSDRTPIRIYDDEGQPLTDTETEATYGPSVKRVVPCPRSRGLTDLTVSFGEGEARNVGGYEIDVRYIIDVTRTGDYQDEVDDMISDIIEAERLERAILTAELVPEPDEIDDFAAPFGSDDKPLCHTHCGFPIGPPGGLGFDDIVLEVAAPGGDLAGRYLIARESTGIGAITALEPREAVDAPVTLTTDPMTMRLIGAASEPEQAMAAAYRDGALQYAGPGGLGGIYAGGLTVDLRRDGAAAVGIDSTYDLTTEEGARAFNALRSDEVARDQITSLYERQMRSVARAWSVRSDREMRVREARMSFERNEDDTMGVASVRVEWSGFAAQTEEGLAVQRPLGEAFVTDQEFRIQLPEGLELSSTSLEPRVANEEHVTWGPNTSMATFSASFAPSSATPTDNATVTATPVDDGNVTSTTTDSTGESGPGFTIVSTLLAVLLAAAIAARRRTR